MVSLSVLSSSVSSAFTEHGLPVRDTNIVLTWQCVCEGLKCLFLAMLPQGLLLFCPPSVVVMQVICSSLRHQDRALHGRKTPALTWLRPLVLTYCYCCGITAADLSAICASLIYNNTIHLANWLLSLLCAFFSFHSSIKWMVRLWYGSDVHLDHKALVIAKKSACWIWAAILCQYSAYGAGSIN